MKNINFTEVDRVRMEPDCYTGPSCDELKPQWIIGVEKEGDVSLDGEIGFKANHFPPGTQIIIEVPECPQCGETSDMQTPMDPWDAWPDCDCGFSWSGWARDMYS